MSEQVSFMPKDLIPKNPKYLVWWTGTLGQAEWLITHSSELRGRALARECKKSLEGVPAVLKPLLSLEQPDLLITKADGTPIMSIEITEQQEFGTNGQQRIARFWSAMLNNVASAYVLPLESYQIEKGSKSDIEVFEESDKKKREVYLAAKTLPYIKGKKLWDAGIRNEASLWDAVKRMDVGVSEDQKSDLRMVYRNHIEMNSESAHIRNVAPSEYAHKIGDEVYKTYIRTPKVTSSMLLTWFEACAQRVPTFVFKLQSEYSLLFRTNGLPHTIEDKQNPHLSFRNLPPAPGTTEIVAKKSGKDEIELFFEMVNAAVKGVRMPELHREQFTKRNEYFPDGIQKDWRSSCQSSKELVDIGSGDYLCSSDVVFGAMNILNSHPSELQTSLLKGIGKFHVYKIMCNVQRSLSDPYSGALATRDVLFCRGANVHKDENLLAFKREEGLAFYVELNEVGAKKNGFVLPTLMKEYKRLLPNGVHTDPQLQLIDLLQNVDISQIVKDIRCGLLFSDLILVSRNVNNKKNVEVLVGIPSLIRAGKIGINSQALKSLVV